MIASCVASLAIVVATATVPEPPSPAPRTADPARPARAPVVVEFVGPEDDPVGMLGFTEALRARVPQHRPLVAPHAGVGASVVRVTAEDGGSYLLEVTPPGSEVLRRRIALSDPEATRRTLALLAAFALEYGEFPVGAEGIEDVEPVQEPAPPKAPAPDPPPVPVAPPEPMVRVLGHLGGGLLIATPTDADATVTLGGATTFDIGLRIRKWIWTGMEVGYSGHPGTEINAHRLAVGAFFGALPKFGPMLFGGRVGAVGGMVDGRGLGDTARRGFVGGSAAVGVDWAPPRGRGLLLGAWASVEIASRTASFVTATESLGLGHARPMIALTLGWSSPR